MATITRELLIRKIPQVFPREDPAVVLAVLDQYGTESYERERERVHLAILRLSEGDVDRLLTWVAAAKRDYRDALAAAEYAGEMGLSPVEMHALPPTAQRQLREQDRRRYEAWLNDLFVPEE